MGAVSVKLGPGPLFAIGLMSGTSHDGVSAALVRIDERRRPGLQLLAFRTFPYAPRLRERLLAVSSGRPADAGAISSLNFELGRRFTLAASRIARLGGIALSQVAFIGSHGHTIFHLPPRRASRNDNASTLQIGEPAVIAATTGVAVVADFRPMDIAVGGEGAPLAVVSHVWLFADRALGRVIQNIGGIANATYLRPGAKLDDPRLLAFDTGPGVVLIDALAEKFSGGQARMDRGGRIAARGRVSERMLGDLMRNPYFLRRPPKSTGREEFGSAYLVEIERRASALAVSGDDLIATVTALTARSIADAIRRFVAPLGRIDEVILSGGGAKNPALAGMIARELPNLRVMKAADVGVAGDALEAVSFAILGYRMLRGRPGNIPSVTGARGPSILGKLTLPPQPASVVSWKRAYKLTHTQSS